MTAFDQAWAVLKGWDVSYVDPTRSKRVFGRQDIDWRDEVANFGYDELADDWWRWWKAYKRGEATDDEVEEAWDRQEAHGERLDDIISRWGWTTHTPPADVGIHPAAPGNIYVDSPEGRMHFRNFRALQEAFPDVKIVTGDDGNITFPETFQDSGDYKLVSDPEMSVTYNYNKLWPGDFRFGELFGQTGEESRPELQRVLEHLEMMAQRDYGHDLNPDYMSELDAGDEGRWGIEGMEGLQNAAEPIRTMLRWADKVPHGEWEIY